VTLNHHISRITLRRLVPLLEGFNQTPLNCHPSQSRIAISTTSGARDRRDTVKVRHFFRFAKDHKPRFRSAIISRSDKSLSARVRQILRCSAFRSESARNAITGRAGWTRMDAACSRWAIAGQRGNQSAITHSRISGALLFVVCEAGRGCFVTASPEGARDANAESGDTLHRAGDLRPVTSWVRWRAFSDSCTDNCAMALRRPRRAVLQWVGGRHVAY
jgi:hypothetical protein